MDQRFPWPSINQVIYHTNPNNLYYFVVLVLKSSPTTHKFEDEGAERFDPTMKRWNHVLDEKLRHEQQKKRIEKIILYASKLI